VGRLIAGNPKEGVSSNPTSTAVPGQLSPPTTSDDANEAQPSALPKPSSPSAPEEEARPSKVHIAEDSRGRPAALPGGLTNSAKRPGPDADALSSPQPVQHDAPLPLPCEGLLNGHVPSREPEALSTGVLSNAVPFRGGVGGGAEGVDGASGALVSPVGNGSVGQPNGNLPQASPAGPGETGVQAMDVDGEAGGRVDAGDRQPKACHADGGMAVRGEAGAGVDAREGPGGLSHADADMAIEGGAAGIEGGKVVVGVEDQGRPGGETAQAGDETVRPGHEAVRPGDGAGVGAEEGRREREGRERDINAEVRAVCRRGFGCCILATPHVDPKVLINMVLPLLCPSASFAIYSLWLQPLAEAAQELKVRRHPVAGLG
jgi:hypothetical protein